MTSMPSLHNYKKTKQFWYFHFKPSFRVSRKKPIITEVAAYCLILYLYGGDCYPILFPFDSPISILSLSASKSNSAPDVFRNKYLFISFDAYQLTFSHDFRSQVSNIFCQIISSLLDQLSICLHDQIFHWLRRLETRQLTMFSFSSLILNV